MKGITDCAYIECGNVLEFRSGFTLCEKCNKVLYGCEKCRSYNRSLAKYCRNCGRILDNKISGKKGTENYNINSARKSFDYPLTQEFQNDDIFCVDIYGKALVLTSSGKSVIIDREGKASKEFALLESKGTIIRKPLVTEHFLYVMTDNGIFAYDLYRLDSIPDNPIVPYEIYNGYAKTEMLQLGDFIVFCSDLNLHYFRENNENPENMKVIDYFENERSFMHLRQNDNTKFITIDDESLIQYELEDENITASEPCIIKDQEDILVSDHVFCFGNSVYYISNGRFRIALISPKNRKLIDIKIKCEYELQRMAKYENINRKILILQHYLGWQLYNHAGRRLESGTKALVSFDNISMVLDNLFIAVESDSMDTSKKTACLYGIERGKIIPLDQVDELIDADKFMNMIYIITRRGNNRTLSGYILTEEVQS